MKTLAEALEFVEGCSFWNEDEPLTVFSRNICGDTPLHLAAHHGDLDAIRVLIENGADANARGEDGETPLHRAAAYLIGTTCSVARDEARHLPHPVRLLERRSIIDRASQLAA